MSNEVRTGARTLLNLDQVVSPSLCQFSDLVWNLKVSLDVTYTKEWMNGLRQNRFKALVAPNSSHENDRSPDAQFTEKILIQKLCHQLFHSRWWFSAFSNGTNRTLKVTGRPAQRKEVKKQMTDSPFGINRPQMSSAAPKLNGEHWIPKMTLPVEICHHRRKTRRMFEWFHGRWHVCLLAGSRGSFASFSFDYWQQTKTAHEQHICTAEAIVEQVRNECPK